MNDLTPEERLKIALDAQGPKPWVCSPPCDAYDAAASDPMVDGIGNRRTRREAGRVIALLDQLDSADRQGETTAAECIVMLMQPSNRRRKH